MPHSFARQVGLQAIMWGLFVVAMLGAWQLCRERDRAVRIPPLSPATRLGSLWIAVPQGWIVQEDKRLALLTASEPPETGLHRILVITQRPVNTAPDEDSLGDELHLAGKTMKITFKGLGTEGLYAQGVFQVEPAGAPWQGYVAVAELPNDVLVKVEMRGVPGFGPIDWANFQEIVDGLKFAPSATPPRPLGPSPIGDWR